MSLTTRTRLILSRSIHTTSQCLKRSKNHDGKKWKNEDPILPNWRREAGLTQNPNSAGVLANFPDYTFMDGRPTPLGSRQEARMNKQKEFGKMIVQFIEEIDFAKERYVRLQAQKPPKGIEYQPKGTELLKK